MAKQNNQKIDLVVFGSSHVIPDHHLPHFLDVHFKNHPKFEKPITYGEGGAEINDEVVDFIKQKMTARAGTPTGYIFFLGSNNLRYNQQKPAKVTALFENILIHGAQIEGCHMVLSSIIPTPKTDETSAEPFKEATSQLRALTNKYEDKASFFNCAKFLVSQGAPIIEYFEIHDWLHLSELGADLVAEMLKNHMENRKCFFKRNLKRKHT